MTSFGMTEDELRRLVTTSLDEDGEPWSKQPGGVLFSDMASIRPGRFYMMGINPGDDGDRTPIHENLCAPSGKNAYANQGWASGDAKSNLQKRVCDLIGALGIAPVDLLSTNLIFRRSRRIKDLPDQDEWLRRCWNVHATLLRRVDPVWVISLGYGRDSAYHFLKSRGVDRTAECEVVGGRAWHYRVTAHFGSSPREIAVLGVMHPGNQPFARWCQGALQYPSALKEFIKTEVLRP